MKVKIHITKEILEKSMYCTGSFVKEADFKERKGVVFNCAVSKAVEEILPDAVTYSDAIKLFENYLNFRLDNPLASIKLPHEAGVFIFNFDKATPQERAKMQPFSFEIEIPDSVIDRIGVNEVNEILSKSLTMEKV